MERRKEGERRWSRGGEKEKRREEMEEEEKKGVNEVDEQGGLVHVEEKEKGLRRRD